MRGRLAVVLALLALPLYADGGTVYYGKLEGAQKPAALVAQIVFDEIPEYQEIKRRGLTESDPEYWVLLNKANEKFYKAVKKVAEENAYDVIVEKGSVRFSVEPPDVTQSAISALAK